jgi:hypothetical protein
MRDGTPSGPLLFLSHAGADTGAARVLKQRIEQAPEARKRGLKVWFDKDNLRAGEPWQTQLEETIGRQATAFAVYVGSRGVINWVEAEVRLGLSRAIGGNGQHFPFIPVLAAGAVGSDALPGFARQFQAVRDVETNAPRRHSPVDGHWRQRVWQVFARARSPSPTLARRGLGGAQGKAAGRGNLACDRDPPRLQPTPGSRRRRVRGGQAAGRERG